MTLIVGVKSGDFAVLCADSQETHGDVKFSVNKLSVFAALGGRWDVVFGGAGLGDLSGALQKRMVATLTHTTVRGIDDVADALESALVKFHQGAVFTSFHVEKPEQKYVAGVVCVRGLDTGEVRLFRYFSTALETVDDYALEGEDRPLFLHVAKRLYRPALPPQKAMQFGVEILSVAESSNYVGGETRVVIVRPDGVVEVEPEHVALIKAHVTRKNMLFDEVSLDCADPTLTAEQLQKTVRLLGNSLVAVNGLYGSKLTPWPSLTLGKLEPPDDDDSE